MRIKQITAVVCIVIGLATTVVVANQTPALARYDTKEACETAGDTWTPERIPGQRDENGNMITTHSPASCWGQSTCESQDGDWVWNASGRSCSRAPTTPSPTTQGSADTNIECAIIDCSGYNSTDSLEDSGVWRILELLINIMLAGVGVAAVIGIVYGAILYTSAGGNPEQVKKAMEIIRNTVIGIVAFALMWSVLQWLIPGGVF